MALLFSEEFETTVGQPPVGWTAVNNTPLVTTTGYHANGCNITGAKMRHSLPAHVSAATLFYVAQGNSVIFQAEQKVVTGTVTSFPAMLSIAFGPDNEVIVMDPNNNVFLAGRAEFTYQGEQPIWTFLQCDLTLSATTIGTASAIKAVATIRVNGENIGTGTGTYLSTLAAYYDNLEFDENIGQAGYVDSIYQYDSILTTPITTPNQGTNIKARVSQGVLEWLGLPSSIDARVSQAVIEHADLPNSANARVSQAVIELITVGGGGWVVYEA